MSDRNSKRSGFGIGEAGQVPATTHEDELEAQRLQPAPRATGRCDRCRCSVPKTWLMWTNTHGSVCPDCYDRMGADD